MNNIVSYLKNFHRIELIDVAYRTDKSKWPSLLYKHNGKKKYMSGARTMVLPDGCAVRITGLSVDDCRVDLRNDTTGEESTVWLNEAN